jgi:two-component system KDP operon response regulator KdpE
MSETAILLVEDDTKMQKLMANQLKHRGYEVRVASSGREALAAVGELAPDIVLLDISLPDIDGIEVCRRLRQASAVPIILVTASDTPQTKVTALETGGDDYLTKPFHMGELIARIRAVLRRTATNQPVVSGAISWDSLTVDLNKREVKRDSEVLHLTKIEYELLRVLITNADRALPYAFLLASVWGPGYDDVRPVHVHICNLRRKLEPGPAGPRRILAIPGIGYRFRGSDEN